MVLLGRGILDWHNSTTAAPGVTSGATAEDSSGQRAGGSSSGITPCTSGQTSLRRPASVEAMKHEGQQVWRPASMANQPEKGRRWRTPVLSPSCFGTLCLVSVPHASRPSRGAGDTQEGMMPASAPRPSVLPRTSAILRRARERKMLPFLPTSNTSALRGTSRLVPAKVGPTTLWGRHP